MLLWLTLVVIIISVAMMFALFSSFIPFSNSYWNVAQYSAAYYAAISAIERGSLAVKYAGHWTDGETYWFNWKSGWKYQPSSNIHLNVGNTWDYWIGDLFSYWNSWATSLYWEVDATTETIPKAKNWDVEPILVESWLNSENYNMINYNQTVLISLNKSLWDIDSSSYYVKSSSNPGKLTNGVSWEFRLNPYLYKRIKEATSTCTDCAILCKSTSCPWEKDQTRSEYQPMIDWVLKWWYSNLGQKTEFSIIPNESTNVSSTSYSVNGNRDSVIRKYNINQYTNKWYLAGTQVNWTLWDQKTTVVFWGSEQVNNFNIQRAQGDNMTWLNVISSQASALKALWWFTSVISSTNVSRPYLSFELINLLRTNATSKHSLYPFLEYRFSFNGLRWTDQYYTIKWEWKVWKYNIKLQVKKPTMDDNALWNFTIIF